MSSINKFLSTAAFLAQQSEMLNKHGALLVINGCIVGKGYNSMRTTFNHKLPPVWSCHAEMAAIWNGRIRLNRRRKGKGNNLCSKNK